MIAKRPKTLVSIEQCPYDALTIVFTMLLSKRILKRSEIGNLMKLRLVSKDFQTAIDCESNCRVLLNQYFPDYPKEGGSNKEIFKLLVQSRWEHGMRVYNAEEHGFEAGKTARERHLLPRLPGKFKYLPFPDLPEMEPSAKEATVKFFKQLMQDRAVEVEGAYADGVARGERWITDDPLSPSYSPTPPSYVSEE